MDEYKALNKNTSNEAINPTSNLSQDSTIPSESESFTTFNQYSSFTDWNELAAAVNALFEDLTPPDPDDLFQEIKHNHLRPNDLFTEISKTEYFSTIRQKKSNDESQSNDTENLFKDVSQSIHHHAVQFNSEDKKPVISVSEIVHEQTPLLTDDSFFEEEILAGKNEMVPRIQNEASLFDQPTKDLLTDSVSDTIYFQKKIESDLKKVFLQGASTESKIKHTKVISTESTQSTESMQIFDPHFLNFPDQTPHKPDCSTEQKKMSVAVEYPSQNMQKMKEIILEPDLKAQTKKEFTTIQELPNQKNNTATDSETTAEKQNILECECMPVNETECPIIAEEQEISEMISETDEALSETNALSTTIEHTETHVTPEEPENNDAISDAYEAIIETPSDGITTEHTETPVTPEEQENDDAISEGCEVEMPETCTLNTTIEHTETHVTPEEPENNDAISDAYEAIIKTPSDGITTEHTETPVTPEEQENDDAISEGCEVEIPETCTLNTTIEHAETPVTPEEPENNDAISDAYEAIIETSSDSITTENTKTPVTPQEPENDGMISEACEDIVPETITHSITTDPTGIPVIFEEQENVSVVSEAYEAIVETSSDDITTEHTETPVTPQEPENDGMISEACEDIVPETITHSITTDPTGNPVILEEQENVSVRSVADDALPESITNSTTTDYTETPIDPEKPENADMISDTYDEAMPETMTHITTAEDTETPVIPKEEENVDMISDDYKAMTETISQSITTEHIEIPATDSAATLKHKPLFVEEPAITNPKANINTDVVTTVHTIQDQDSLSVKTESQDHNETSYNEDIIEILLNDDKFNFNTPGGNQTMPNTNFNEQFAPEKIEKLRMELMQELSNGISFNHDDETDLFREAEELLHDIHSDTAVQYNSNSQKTPVSEIESPYEFDFVW